MKIYDKLYKSKYIYENISYNSMSEIEVKNININIKNVLYFINNLHMFGTETIAKEIELENFNYEYKHNRIEISNFEDYFKIFEKELIEELIYVTRDKKNIGILLSGGVDSRIIVVLINHLLKVGIIKSNISIINWGIPDSRDVIYAKKIAEKYKMNFINYNISAETLANNIILSSKIGCESSPVHLHAINEISKIRGLDIILIGTYGDSIGRGEYSQKSVKNIKIHNKILYDLFGILNSKVEKSNYYIKEKKYTKEEIELFYISNYLRRTFLPIFNIIQNNIKIHQVFTSCELINNTIFMNRSLRGDRLYFEIFKKYDSDILNIPWARTGNMFYTNIGNGDFYKKNFHYYGRWIRNDLNTEIMKEINSGVLAETNIFNIKNINYLNNINRKYYKNDSTNRIDEILIWICAISKYLKDKSVNNKMENIKFKKYFIMPNLYLLSKRIK